MTTDTPVMWKSFSVCRPGVKYIGHIPSSVMGRLSSRKAPLSFRKPNLLDSTLEELTTCLAHRSSMRLNEMKKKVIFTLINVIF